MGKLWAAEFCPQAEFVVKADDDMFVDLHAVLSFTRQFRSRPSYTAGRFLLCARVWRSTPVIRKPKSVDGKWFVTYEENKAGDGFLYAFSWSSNNSQGFVNNGVEMYLRIDTTRPTAWARSTSPTPPRPAASSGPPTSLSCSGLTTSG